jgi:hypothetical protein
MNDQPPQAWYELLGTDIRVPADPPHGAVTYADAPDDPRSRPAIATLRKFGMPPHPATCVQPVQYLVPDDMPEGKVLAALWARHGIRRRWGKP